MKQCIKRLVCLFPPFSWHTELASLRKQFESVTHQLETIDPSFLLSRVRTTASTLKEGEAASVYYVEILSHCNLRCRLCAHGNASLFQRAPGRMSLEHFENILDKIKEESPSALINPYHHCEPALHPQLPEMMRAIRRRNFDSIPSFNLNYVNRLDDLLSAGMDKMEVSISGFSQEIYARSHREGNIELVKKNLLAVRETADRMGISVWVRVLYHMYKDNINEDFDAAKQFVEDLGFVFFPIWARNISTEIILLYLRDKGLSRYIPPHGKTSWFASFPNLDQEIMNEMERIIYLPEDYLYGKWKDITPLTCSLNRARVHIRWDGKVNLCDCSFDDRLALGNFLEMKPREIAATRQAHPVCLECRANNVLFYLEYTDMENINTIARSRLDDCATGRNF